LGPPEAEFERPKSPWTPSYSVITQGSVGEDLHIENEIAELEQLPSRAEVDNIYIEATIQEVDVVVPNPATARVRVGALLLHFNVG
jgi:hypothetical protein